MNKPLNAMDSRALDSRPGSLARTLLVAAATMGAGSSCHRRAAPQTSGDVEIEQAGTWVGLRVRTTGERRRPRQVVVLLHGWGAPGTDLVPLGDELEAPGRLFVFPEAPLVSPGGGRAWWPLDLERLQAERLRGHERDLRAELPPGMEEASVQVQALVQEVARRAQVPLSAVVIGGFSQGAMLATEVALRTEGSLGGLVILSGSLVRETDWLGHLQLMRSRKAGWPVFMSHGQSDPVLPFRVAEALRDHLQAATLAVSWVPFRGGHEIPGGVLARLQAFLAAGLPSGH